MVTRDTMVVSLVHLEWRIHNVQYTVVTIFISRGRKSSPTSHYMDFSCEKNVLASSFR